MEVTDASSWAISLSRGTARARGPPFRAPWTMRKRGETLTSSLEALSQHGYGVIPERVREREREREIERERERAQKERVQG